MSEEWRAIPGFGGRYEVSDQGAVRSHLVSGRYDRTSPEPRSVGQRRTAKGYLQVTLYVDRQHVHRYVHRLVLSAFVGPCPQGLQTRHLNGNAADNRLVNLRYGTQSENERDKIRHGTRRPRARKTHCPKGHPYDTANTYAGGGRRCKACTRQWMRDYRRRLATKAVA